LMSIRHMIFMDESCWFFSPDKMYFGYIVRTGKLKCLNRGDFEFITKKKSFFVKSIKGRSSSIIRQININSFDPKNKVAFFQYDEPIPYEIIQIYKHRIITLISKYVEIRKIIMDLNSLLYVQKEAFNDEYLTWLDEISNGHQFGDELTEHPKLRTFINLFSNGYYTTLFGRAYNHDIENLIHDSERIIFKLYEMKYLNDIGMVKII